ncbi:MAG: PQQ-binding-like beta-propeller repeat protein [Halobacteria archaeon]
MEHTSRDQGLIQLSLQVLLLYDGDGNIQSAPTIYRGVAYIGIKDSVKAIDLGNGEEVWTKAGDKWSAQPPKLDNGTVYAGQQDGSFFAINSSSGDEVWTKNLSGGVGAPAAVSDDQIYVYDKSRTLSAIDKDTGDVNWKKEMTGNSTSAPVVNPKVDKNDVYVMDVTGLHAFDESDGDRKWLYKRNVTEPTSPALKGRDTLFIGDNDGTVISVDADTGEEKWSTSVVSYDEDYSSQSAPSVAGDNLYVSYNQEGVVLLNATTGEKLESYGQVPPVPRNVVVGGMVYTVLSDGEMGRNQRFVAIGSAPKTEKQNETKTKEDEEKTGDEDGSEDKGKTEGEVMSGDNETSGDEEMSGDEVTSGDNETSGDEEMSGDEGAAGDNESTGDEEKTENTSSQSGEQSNGQGQSGYGFLVAIAAIGAAVIARDWVEDRVQ